MIDLRQKCILNTCYNTLKKNLDKEVIHMKDTRKYLRKIFHVSVVMNLVHTPQLTIFKVR